MEKLERVYPGEMAGPVVEMERTPQEETTKVAMIESAFAQEILSVQIGKAFGFSVSGLSAFSGDSKVRPGTPMQWVHVISRPAGGEIRGYALIDGALRLRTPAYPPDWPELDAVVATRLNVKPRA